MTQFVLDRVKKHCGKRRKCWLPAFSPVPTMFSKAVSFQGHFKGRDCVVKSFRVKPDEEVKYNSFRLAEACDCFLAKFAHYRKGKENVRTSSLKTRSIFCYQK